MSKFTNEYYLNERTFECIVYALKINVVAGRGPCYKSEAYVAGNLVPILKHKHMSIYNLLRFVNNLRSFNDCFLQHKFTYLPLSQIHTISVSYKTFSSSCKAVGIYIYIYTRMIKN